LEAHGLSLKPAQAAHSGPVITALKQPPGSVKGELGTTSKGEKQEASNIKLDTTSEEQAKEALKSPRIVKRAPDGTWQEVEPYPAKPPSPSVDKGSDWRPDNPSRTNGPKRVNKDEMTDEKKKEYEALLVKRTKDKVEAEKTKLREKAAEGALSPKEVGIAVEMAAEAISREKRAVGTTEAESQPEKVDTAGLAKERLEILRKQRDKVKNKVAKGELDKAEAEVLLRKLERGTARTKTECTEATLVNQHRSAGDVEPDIPQALQLDPK